MNDILNGIYITPIYNKDGLFLRRICSFKSRNRSITSQSSKMIKMYWSTLGINFQPKPIDFNNIFERKNIPIMLEIGFGCGENLFHNILHYKNYNFLGIEVYVPGISQFFQKLYVNNLLTNNVKIIAHDATEVLQYMILDHSLHIVQCFFPDPWFKKRHSKRRMFQIQFLKLLSKKLIYGGILHIITDYKIYFQNIINNVKEIKQFLNISNYFNLDTVSLLPIKTKFANKAKLQKNKIFHLVLQCIK